MTSNTYSLPNVGLALALSRIRWNETLRSISGCMYGPSVPTSLDYTDEGVAVVPPTGSLYRSSLFNALYAYDPVAGKGGVQGIGGNYTRVGVGHRNFESITTLVANVAYIEPSELLTTVGSGANYRLYMKTSNSGGIVDVGLPAPSTVVNSMIVDRTIANTKITAASITNNEIAAATIKSSLLQSDLTLPGTTITVPGSGTFGNVTATGADFGVTFGDATRQTTRAMHTFSSVGSGVSLIESVTAGVLEPRKLATSLSLSGDSLGTGSFTVSSSGGTITFGLTLGTGVGVSVGVGVGIAK